jgi:hypothetical protein
MLSNLLRRASSGSVAVTSSSLLRLDNLVNIVSVILFQVTHPQAIDAEAFSRRFYD